MDIEDVITILEGLYNRAEKEPMLLTDEEKEALDLALYNLIRFFSE